MAANRRSSVSHTRRRDNDDASCSGWKSERDTSSAAMPSLRAAPDSSTTFLSWRASVRRKREAGEKALAFATELGERGNEAHVLCLLGQHRRGKYACRLFRC